MTAKTGQAPAAAIVPQRPINTGDDARGAYDAVMAAIERDRDKLVRSLAAVNIAPERFLTVVDQALRRNPDLLRCTPSSILKALLDAAELGLVPSGLVGQAYLVPYRNKRTGRQEAQLIPGYRGLIDLVRRSGELRSIEARTVRQNDEFDIVFGTDGRVFHRPYINRDREVVVLDDGITTVEKDGGTFIGVYLIAELAFGRHVEWMSYAEVEAVRSRSKAASSGPWVSDWSEMAKKTVTRRGVKYLPLSIDAPINRALALEDEAEANAAAPIARRATARDAFQAALGMGEAEAPTEPEAILGDDPCESVSPDGLGCELMAAHEGPHQSEGQEAVWPNVPVEPTDGAG